MATSDLPVVANPLGYIIRRERSLDEDDEFEVLRGVIPSKEDGDGPGNWGSGSWGRVPLSMTQISIIIAIFSISIGLGWVLYCRPVGHVFSDTYPLSSQIQTLEKVTNEQRGQLLAHSQRIEEATNICRTLELLHQSILKRSESLQHAFQLHRTAVGDLTTRLASVSLQVEAISQTHQQQHSQVGDAKTQIEYLSIRLQRTTTRLEEVTREVASLREQMAGIVPQVESVDSIVREWKEADWTRSEVTKKVGEAEATLLGLQHRTSELESGYRSLDNLAREWKEADWMRSEVTKKVGEAEAAWLELQHRTAILEDRYQALETYRLSVRILNDSCAQDEHQVDRPDFALLSAGARVIPALTTPTLKLTTSRSWLSSFFHSPRFGNPPEVALQPDLHNGNCWPFAGEVGQLAITLARTIYVQEVVIEHIPRHLSFDISSAPMDMELWGIEEGLPPSTWPSSRSEERADTSDPPTLPQGISSLLIARFRYDITGSSPSQAFPVSSDLVAARFQSVVLRIKNNWGNSINVLSFSPCGKFLASGADDGVVYIFSPREGTTFMKVVAHHAVTTLAWHPTGNGRLYVGREDGKVVFLDIHDAGLSGSYKLPISSDQSDSVVRALALDHSGMHLAVAKGSAVVLLKSDGDHDQQVPFVQWRTILSPPSAEGLADEVPAPHSVQFLTYDGGILLLVSYLCHGVICVDPAQSREAVRWHLVPPSYRMAELPHGRDIIQALAYHRSGSVHYMASGTSEKGVNTYIKIWKAGKVSKFDSERHRGLRPRHQLGALYGYIFAAVTTVLIAVLVARFDDLKVNHPFSSSGVLIDQMNTKPSIDIWVDTWNSTVSRLQAESSQFLSVWKTRIIRWLLQLLSESDANPLTE
ncbi:hypothetical protein EYR36_008452 [Pleurotus pulmonarius]|nr:hypothetical protein EYR36_008452 [Pleurotus pulmonarius]